MTTSPWPSRRATAAWSTTSRSHLVTATSDTVLNSNEAYAFASCTHCAAVAVSFQVVRTIGNARVIVPKNVSTAVAYNCISCLTAAMAIQLDLSLPAAPHGSSAAQLAALWKQVQAVGKHISSFSLAEIDAHLQQYERQIEQILHVPAVSSSATAVTGAPSTSSSGSPTGSSPSPHPSSSPSDTGSTPSLTPSPTAPPSSNPAPLPTASGLP